MNTRKYYQLLVILLGHSFCVLLVTSLSCDTNWIKLETYIHGTSLNNDIFVGIHPENNMWRWVNPNTLSEELIIIDDAPHSGGVFWSSTSMKKILCSADGGQTFKDATVFEMCNNGIGTHECGVGGGWILWHAGETVDTDGNHPCPVNENEGTAGLVELQYCEPATVAQAQSHSVPGIPLAVILPISICFGLMVSIYLCLHKRRRQRQTSNDREQKNTPQDSSIYCLDFGEEYDNLFSFRAFLSTFSVALAVFDLVTDILFSVSLLNSENETDRKYGLGVLVFVVLPMICNFVSIVRFHDGKMSELDPERRYRDWMLKNDILATVMGVLSAVSTELLAVAALGFWRLNMPLDMFDILTLRSLGILSSFLEDVPQIIIVAMYVSKRGDWNNGFAQISFVTSIISFSFTLVFRVNAYVLLKYVDVNEQASSDSRLGWCSDSQKPLENTVTEADVEILRETMGVGKHDVGQIQTTQQDDRRECPDTQSQENSIVLQ